VIDFDPTSQGPGASVFPGTEDSPADRSQFTYSVVIPVFNSEGVVSDTVSQVVAVLKEAGLDHEVILVNDGSSDRSWEVISESARTIPNVVALDLLRNYGQHHANLVGFREARGDFVITMDDDLQNPPDQALLLIDEAMKGKDVVFGEFAQKQASGYRRLGSKLITMVNRRIFGQPPDLAVSNYRILRRDVVDRICRSRTAYPYITGQALIYSRNRSNVVVRHEPRSVGQSNYSMLRILKLVLTIMFSYSSFPLRLAAGFGFGLAGLALLLGLFYLVLGALGATQVQGWTTIVVLLSVFHAFTFGMLSMLGEYVVRTLNTVSAGEGTYVISRVSR
jgi:glycosyltransferase involved in cell wall biosynthesis